ncbi:MAG: DUF2304 domain-containing protein [Chloroflexi bacterium]|nr:DUF2304 domain-containing protein [Chloroflexota bacterium]
MDRTQFVAVLSAVIVFLFVLELVRRRQLREEYSWLWLMMSGGYLIVAIFPATLHWFTAFIGAVQPAVTFNFLGVFFLVLICIQFSMRLSRLTNRNKYLAQQIAILDSELRTLSHQIDHTHIDGDFTMPKTPAINATYDQTKPTTSLEKADVSSA